MTTERSDKIYDGWRQAADKFDYFVLGVTGALCAYISQQYKPTKIGLNPGTLELAALIILVAAAVAGFKRIEKTMLLSRVNHKWLRTKEERGALMAAGSGALFNQGTGDIYSPDMVPQLIRSKTEAIPILAAQIAHIGGQAELFYGVRNWLIFVGFCALVASKVWLAYV